MIFIITTNPSGNMILFSKFNGKITNFIMTLEKKSPKSTEFILWVPQMYVQNHMPSHLTDEIFHRMSKNSNLLVVL